MALLSSLACFAVILISISDSDSDSESLIFYGLSYIDVTRTHALLRIKNTSLLVVRHYTSTMQLRPDVIQPELRKHTQYMTWSTNP